MAERGGKVFGRIADWFIPGNAYNSTTDRWNPATTKTGIAGVIADQLVPGGSNIVGIAANSGMFGSDFARQLRNEGIYNTMADQYGDFREGLANQYLQPGVDVGGGNPQVSVGNPQYLPQGYGQTTSVGGLFDGYLNNNVQQATSNTDARMNTAMQGIQDRINAQGSTASLPSVNARPIGGQMRFGGGSVGGYNNGAGAGTGFGAANFTNDAWGQTALGFGIGAAANNNSIARSDAMKAAALNKK